MDELHEIAAVLERSHARGDRRARRKLSGDRARRPYADVSTLRAAAAYCVTSDSTVLRRPRTSSSISSHSLFGR